MRVVDRALRIDAPAFGVLVPNEGLADGVALSADLDVPSPGFFSENRGHFCAQIRRAERPVPVRPRPPAPASAGFRLDLGLDLLLNGAQSRGERR